MRKLITILSLLLSLAVSGQVNFTFTPITTDFPRHGGGFEFWNNQNGPYGTMDIPTFGAPQQALDDYYRYSATHFFANPTVAGDSTLDWTFFDNRSAQLIAANHQVGGFRIMGQCNNCDVGNNKLVSYNGGQNAYPKYWHDHMQSEPVKDWLSNAGDQTQWIANWNSWHYQRLVGWLCTQIKSHINSTTISGVPLSRVYRVYDIGFYGNYSEQHSAQIVPDGSTTGATYPAGTFGGANFAANLDSILNKQVQAMRGNNMLFTIPFNSLDGIWLSNTNNPAAYGAYILNHPDSIGFRFDHLSDDQGYDHDYWENNNRLGTGMNAKIINRWKYSPLRGEPPGYGGQPTNLSFLPTQVNNLHLNSFGNGNYAQYVNATGLPPVATAASNNARQAAKNAGYRLRLTGGSANAGASLTINLNWINEGVTPTYEDWNVQYLLKNGSGTVVSTLTSAFNPKRFLPSAAPQTKTDVFGIPAIPTGTYGLYVVVKDPVNYRTPMFLAITGRQGDGSYFLANITLGGGVNQNPVADAGANQSITTSTATLTGSGTDADGTIASYLWTQLSGPNTATIVSASSATTNLTGLIGGSYVFNLLVTDNSGGTSGDNVTITVNLNTPPVANAGPNQTITLPTSSATMAGSGTDNIGIASYLWTKISGPATFVITTPSSATTTITGMTTAGVYTYRLTVTDGSGLTNSDDMTVTVLAGNTAPIANAGTDQTITAPTSSVTLNGTLSSDNVGITAYLWTQVGGAAGPTIVSPTGSTTSVTGLSPGLYIFRLRVQDVAGLFSTDDVQITVNSVANTAPVANAGPNQTVTLPTNFVQLNGSASTDNVGITSYSWVKQSGPVTYSLLSPNSAITNAESLQVGVYVFRLTVTDAASLTSFDDVTITVQALPNTAPIAVAGSNQAITLPTSSTTVNGSGSSDNVGIVNYLWTQVSGPITAVIATSGNVSTGISGMTTAGTYVFRLRVEDVAGLFDTDDLTITVNPAPNNAPVANAGNPQTITLPINTVALSGAGSTDDVAVTGYLWSQISGPGTAVISAATSSSTNMNNLIEGVYFFQLQVSDAGGLTDTDIVVITVLPAPFVPPIIGTRSGFRTNRKFLPRAF